MRVVGAVEEDGAEDAGRQRLDAAAEDFGGAGPRRDRRYFDVVVGEVLGRSAGGEDLHVLRTQRAGEVDDAGLVGDGEDGAGDGHDAQGRTLPPAVFQMKYSRLTMS